MITLDGKEFTMNIECNRFFTERDQTDDHGTGAERTYKVSDFVGWEGIGKIRSFDGKGNPQEINNVVFRFCMESHTWGEDNRLLEHEDMILGVLDKKVIVNKKEFIDYRILQLLDIMKNRKKKTTDEVVPFIAINYGNIENKKTLVLKGLITLDGQIKMGI